MQLLKIYTDNQLYNSMSSVYSRCRTRNQGIYLRKFNFAYVIYSRVKFEFYNIIMNQLTSMTINQSTSMYNIHLSNTGIKKKNTEREITDPMQIVTQTFYALLQSPSLIQTTPEVAICLKDLCHEYYYYSG